MSFPTLPAAWVDRIFSVMTLTYGSDWSMKWEGIAEDALRAKWATDLGAYINRGDAIAFALDHLPVDRPPNSLQFRVTCMAAPDPNPPTVDQMLGFAPAVPQLPGMPPKKADLTKLKAAMTRYEELRAEAAKNPRGWAKALRARERAGELLTPLQRQQWRTALRIDDPAVSNLGASGGGTIRPIPNEELPPAMQRRTR